MKKSFLWLAGAAVLAACAQTELETVETKEPAKQEIKLDVYMQGQTRADETTILNQFQLAILKDGALYGDSPYYVFWDEMYWGFYTSSVDENGDADLHSVSPTWPTDNSTLDFYAWSTLSFYPRKVVVGTFDIDNKKILLSSDDVSSLRGDDSQGTDWVVAYAPNESKATTTKLTFKHVMSKVTFKVTPPDDKLLYYIKSIKVDDYPSANYNYAEGADCGYWDGHGTEMDTITVFKADDTKDAVTYYYDVEGKNSSQAVAKQLGSNWKSDTFFLIPDPTEQVVPRNVTVEYYVFTQNDGNLVWLTKYEDGFEPGAKTATLSLTPGEVVEVNIKLQEEEVTMSLETSVEGWGTTVTSEDVTPGTARI